MPRVPAAAGDVLLVLPGRSTRSAAGPSHELQQSDLTYRVSDWGRSAAACVDESLRALHADAHAEARGRGFQIDGGLLEIPELRLELPSITTPIVRRPAGRSPEVVTAIRGSLRLTADDWSETLAARETVVVPAAVAAYELAGAPEGLAAIGSLP
jgi:mannose-6-phosphate isomerase class I